MTFPRSLSALASLLALGLVGLQGGCSSEGADGDAKLAGSGEGTTYGGTITDDGSSEGDPSAVPPSPISGTSSGGSSGSSGATCTPGLVTASVTLAASPTGPVYATGAPDGTTWVAWPRGAGKSVVTHLDVAGKRIGTDLEVSGDGVHGLAAKTGEVGLLVRRAPDVLAFLRLAETGETKTDAKIVGNSNHAVVGSEWFDYQASFFADGGRLLWTGNRWVAYAPIFRRWPDNIGHTGDTLRVFGADGAPTTGGWDWGCSHSLDVRLAADGANGFGSACLSDCYPSKAVLFGKSATISSEPSGNCSGTSGAVLGGLTRAAGSFWAAYGSAEGRSSRDVAVARLDAKGATAAKTWVTSGGGTASGIHLAPFASGLIVGWNQGGKGFVRRLDATGAPSAAAEPLATPLRERDDFVTWPSVGDARVGWVTTSGSTLTLSTLHACP